MKKIINKIKNLIIISILVISPVFFALFIIFSILRG